MKSTFVKAVFSLSSGEVLAECDVPRAIKVCGLVSELSQQLFPKPGKTYKLLHGEVELTETSLQEILRSAADRLELGVVIVDEIVAGDTGGGLPEHMLCTCAGCGKKELGSLQVVVDLLEESPAGMLSRFAWEL